MKFVYKNNWFTVFFLIWTFIHILLLINGLAALKDFPSYLTCRYCFWPYRNTDIYIYGWLEFFVYETLPLLIFFIINLVSKDIKKTFDKNN